MYLELILNVKKQNKIV